MDTASESDPEVDPHSTLPLRGSAGHAGRLPRHQRVFYAPDSDEEDFTLQESFGRLTFVCLRA